MDTKIRTYVFKSGGSVSGTIEQIFAVATALGETVDATLLGVIPAGYYQSSSKGLVKISDMNEIHIINAMNKYVLSYYERIKPTGKITNEIIQKYLKAFVRLGDDPQVSEMFMELASRVNGKH